MSEEEGQTRTETCYVAPRSCWIPHGTYFYRHTEFQWSNWEWEQLCTGCQTTSQNGPKLFVLPDHQANTIADVLVTEVFLRLGVPRIIHSDQGPEFQSHLLESICQLLEIKKTRTTPYPQSDGQRGLIVPLHLCYQNCALRIKPIGTITHLMYFALTGLRSMSQLGAAQI